MRYSVHRLLFSGLLVLPLSAQAISFPSLFETLRGEARAASLVKAVPAPAPELAEKIVVKKGERRLYLMRNGHAIRSYRVALGYQPAGHKSHQGDGRTPEGRYYIDQRNDRSKYRKALRISYPSPADRMRALSRGVDPGGLIMIHGQPNNPKERKFGDWTFGCIAVTNMEIDEIWSLTSQGTPIEILP